MNNLNMGMVVKKKNKVEESKGKPHLFAFHPPPV